MASNLNDVDRKVAEEEAAPAIKKVPDCIRKGELHILTDKELAELIRDGALLGIEPVDDKGEMVIRTTGKYDYFRLGEGVLNITLKKDPTNFQVSSCGGCHEKPAFGVIGNCGHSVCVTCGRGSNTSCNICGTILRSLRFFQDTHEPSSYPEDLYLESSKTKPLLRYPFDYGPKEEQMEEPPKTWTEEELKEELQVLKFGAKENEAGELEETAAGEGDLGERPVDKMKAVLRGLGKPMPEGTTNQCFQSIKAHLIENRNLKSALLKLLGPGPHCNKCLKSTSVCILHPCNHRACKPCLDLSKEKCPACLIELQYSTHVPIVY